MVKTLKDISLQANENYLGKAEYFGGEECIRNRLKAEAIAWIKELENPDNKGTNPDGTFNIPSRTTIEWIKHFFSISEGDLCDNTCHICGSKEHIVCGSGELGNIKYTCSKCYLEGIDESLKEESK
ncbi:hypothetical protein M0R04_11275 [Candidatus Dojkabacteria bacterium]|nr:hypothetical protein [Candidatus Dojkabacteria bacterium]